MLVFDAQCVARINAEIGIGSGLIRKNVTFVAYIEVKQRLDLTGFICTRLFLVRSADDLESDMEGAACSGSFTEFADALLQGGLLQASRRRIRKWRT